MTNAELITMILQRLGGRENVTKMRTVVVNEIRMFIDQKERTMDELPWFLEATMSETMVINQYWFDLPSNFLKEVEDSGMIIKDSASNTYYGGVKRIPDETRARIAALAPKVPEVYSIYGNRFLFGPAPDKAYTFEVPYGRKSALFVENGNQLTDWAAEATNALACTIQEIIARQHLQDDQMAQRYAPLASQAWMQFKDYCNTRKFTNLTISSGDDE